MTASRIGNIVAFFSSKRETLLHFIVEGAIKAVVGGLFVAALSFYLISKIEDSIDLVETRAALKQYQNQMLSETLAGLSNNFVGLSCTRENIVTLAQTDCANKLGDFRSLLSRQNELLKAVISEGDFSSIDHLIDASTILQQLSRNSNTENYNSAIRNFNSAFTKTMSSIASNFK